MSKKILIIGFGNMGKSHYLSFINSKIKYNVDIYDLKNVIKKEEKKKLKKINFISIFPKNRKYDLAILATSSKVRFTLLMKLLKFNVIRKIVLEKFVFDKIINFHKFDDYLNKNKSLKVAVNTWGKYLYRNLKINKNLIINKDVNVYLPRGTMLTNFIHYADFFLNDKSNFQVYLKFDKIIKSKRRGYHEALGSIKLETQNNTLTISTLNKQKKHIIFLENKYKILINHEGKFVVFNKNKIIQKINFPIASKLSEKYFMRNKKTKISNYRKISSISQALLEKLNKLNNLNRGKKIKIS